MRVSAIFGLILVLFGLIVLYLLRGFLVEVIMALLDGAGLVIGFILIILGLLLIFGRRIFRRGFSWHFSATDVPEI